MINFDLRVLQNKCDQLGISLTLGRCNESIEWRKANADRAHYFALVPGRVVLDGIDTLKAATYNFESFSLEFVSRQVLGRGKLIHPDDDRGMEITRLFHHDKRALACYNLEDCQLVLDIFDKLELIDFAIARARMTGLPMDKTGGSVMAFENLYLPRLHRAGYVAPNMGWVQTNIQAPGGYVMDSKPGLYEHVLVLDFKSLYPSIIRTFCIDPLSLISALLQGKQLEDDRSGVFYQGDESDCRYADSEWVPGFNGALFSKKHHLLPSIIERLWDEREEAKRAQNAALSQAIKIIMNSFYGVLGTTLCRFFDPRLSSSITLRGHDILQQTRKLIEQRGYDVIYGDTDSVFVWLSGTYSNQQAQAIGRRLASELNLWWSNALQNKFGLQSFLEIEFETHYQRFHMPTMRGSDAGTKKRYAGMAEANGQQRIVFKGLENVRTDWTRLARDFQRRVYWEVFHDRDIKGLILEVHQQLLSGQLDDQLTYRKRLRRNLVDYQKNIPPHVQAARKADGWLAGQGLPPRYSQGGWIEYKMTVNGPEPLEYCPSALDYDHYIERQLAPAVDGLLQCLDTSYHQIVNQQLSLFG